MNTLKPRVGIIGGAGAMAGAILFEKIIETCQKKYRCTHDADFPYIFLINYPFADMLSDERESIVIESQVKACFDSFLLNDVSIAAIACNTLHNFLPYSPKGFQLVHMVEETEKFLKLNNWKNPLVFCTSTSAKAKLHAQFFPCRYPDATTQKILDVLIDKITLGGCMQEAANQLNAFIDEEPIILGCTELSLLNERVPLNIKKLCDPNIIVAEKICELIFKNEPTFRTTSLEETEQFSSFV